MCKVQEEELFKICLRVTQKVGSARSADIHGVVCSPVGIFAHTHLTIVALKPGPRFSKFLETLFNQQGSDNLSENSVKNIEL